MTKMRKCCGGRRRLNLYFFLWIKFGWQRGGRTFGRDVGVTAALCDDVFSASATECT